MIRSTLTILRGLLDQVGAHEDEYVLFGSAVLLLHGLRTPESVGDVDVFVTQRIYDAWLPHRFMVEHRPAPADPPYLAWYSSTPQIHAFYEWTERDAGWITVESCFASREFVETWPCISLAMMRSIKVGAFAANPDSVPHEKHLADIDEIDLYLSGLRGSAVRAILPHFYVPDWEAMGDCDVCGGVEGSTLHIRPETKPIQRGAESSQPVAEQDRGRADDREP